MTTVSWHTARLSHVSPSSMVCSTARADFPAACAARGGARRTDALARLGALVALLAAWFAQRSPRFALLAPTISLSSLHELGHRSWEVSIIQKGVQRSRNCLDSQRVDLRARPRGGVPRHREEASARRQKIQKTQRDEDPSPPLPPPGQCQKFRLYLDTIVLGSSQVNSRLDFAVHQSRICQLRVG